MSEINNNNHNDGTDGLKSFLIQRVFRSLKERNADARKCLTRTYSEAVRVTGDDAPDAIVHLMGAVTKQLADFVLELADVHPSPDTMVKVCTKLAQHPVVQCALYVANPEAFDEATGEFTPTEHQKYCMDFDEFATRLDADSRNKLMDYLWRSRRWHNSCLRDEEAPWSDTTESKQTDGGK